DTRNVFWRDVEEIRFNRNAVKYDERCFTSEGKRWCLKDSGWVVNGQTGDLSRKCISQVQCRRLAERVGVHLLRCVAKFSLLLFNTNRSDNHFVKAALFFRHCDIKYRPVINTQLLYFKADKAEDEYGIWRSTDLIRSIGIRD